MGHRGSSISVLGHVERDIKKKYYPHASHRSENRSLPSTLSPVSIRAGKKESAAVKKLLE